jgi:predicted RNA-binding protein Jag
MTTQQLGLDNENVKEKIKSQLRMVRKEKIDSFNILSKVAYDLKDVYTITKKTNCELTIKVDKKRKPEEIESEVRRFLTSYINNENIDVDLLFRIIVRENDITIQTKRYNER